MDTKEYHLSSLYTKNGNKDKIVPSFDEQVTTQLIEQEERVKDILEFLKTKEDMCADMFKGMLLKNKSVKRSQIKKNRLKKKKKKTKKKQEEKGAKGNEEIYRDY